MDGWLADRPGAREQQSDTKKAEQNICTTYAAGVQSAPEDAEGCAESPRKCLFLESFCSFLGGF